MTPSQWRCGSIHAHAHDTAFHSPRLAITSPTPRCGKSSLLRCIARLAPRHLATSNISASALFRVIEKAKPTLLVDEIDQVDEEKRRELVGIINSSHCRLDACVVRTVAVGDDHQPRAFSTWAPIALAAIGHLPITWGDRAIVIRMKRRAKDEPIERMRLDRDQGFETLARKCARWAPDHPRALSSADPWTPPQLNDRGSDNWRHLIAIADLAGDDWPRRARAAAVALSTDAEGEAEALGVMLLADLRELFETTSQDDALDRDPGRPAQGDARAAMVRAGPRQGAHRQALGGHAPGVRDLLAPDQERWRQQARLSVLRLRRLVGKVLS
jgi:hypothetical protein